MMRYATNVPAHKPLLQLLDTILLTPQEAAEHLRYSVEMLSNWRRAGKGPPFIKLPTGGIRYAASDLAAWQMAGLSGPLTLERVQQAVLACAAVPIEARSAINDHLEKAFDPQ